MGLFKEFKEDFTQAVDELVPGGDIPATGETKERAASSLAKDVDIAAEMEKVSSLFQEPSKAATPNVKPTAKQPAKQAAQAPIKKTTEEKPFQEEKKMAEEKKLDLGFGADVSDVQAPAETVATPKGEVTSEVTVITEGTVITGNIQSSGSIEVRGGINGDIDCNGKLMITGTLKGNSVSSEFVADNAKIEGEIKTDGTVRIALGSVVIGNISATSAVIAGAIKGDIDVPGPVVVDTSAVVMGNIKSRSVQLNNGAVIEGFISQSYAEVDVAKLFENR
ncbi:hypothetical protein FACS1894111_09290 [Clostridia bacterium]|nr:hypothetical protein FACS1894111_09290 [Clostridia bacterium]